MATKFDPYYTWLGIPPDEQPANLYRLLGLRTFENNFDVIENAADRQMSHLRSVSSGVNVAQAQNLLNEVAAARVLLLNGDRKVRYDSELRANLARSSAAASAPSPQPSRPATVSPRPIPIPPNAANASQTPAPVLSRNPPSSRWSSALVPRIVGAGVLLLGVVALIAFATRDPKNDKTLVAKPDLPNDAGHSTAMPSGEPKRAAKPQGDNSSSQKPAVSERPSSSDDPIKVDAVELPPRAPEPDFVSQPIVSQDESHLSVNDDDERQSLGDLLAAPEKVVTDSRLPVPNPSVAAAKDREIRELFKSDFVKKSSADSTALAVRLLDLARESTDGPVTRYVLLELARKLAIEAGDSATAKTAAEELAREFSIDGITLLCESMLAAAKANVPLAARMTMASNLEIAVSSAFVANQFELAEQLNTHLARFARLNKHMPHVNRSAELAEALTAVRQEWPAAQIALKRLTDSPDDREANTIVGKFYCFSKNEWDKGLPLLARSSDEELASLAKGELEPNPGEGHVVQLADRWWNVGENLIGHQRATVQRRAGNAYVQVLPKLSGLERATVEKKLNSAKVNHWISRDAKYVVASGSSLQLHDKPMPSFLDGSDRFYRTSAQDEWAFQSSGRGAYLVVDLGRMAEISRMEIINRPVQQRSKGMTVSIGSRSNGPWKKIWFAEEDRADWTFDVPPASRARYIRIALDENKSHDPWFHLRSMKVFGYFKGE